MTDDLGVRPASWRAGTAQRAGVVAFAQLMALDVAARPEQSALHPAGVQAAHILSLWNLTLVICAAVFAAVLLATLVALLRNRRNGDSPPLAPRPGERTAARTRNAVIAATVASVVLDRKSVV